MSLSYEKQRFVTQTVQPNDFGLWALKEDFSSSGPRFAVRARRLIDYDWRKAAFFAHVDLVNYQDRPLRIEAPVSESNCRNPPVKGVRAVYCSVYSRISDPLLKKSQQEQSAKEQRDLRGRSKRSKRLGIYN